MYILKKGAVIKTREKIQIGQINAYFEYISVRSGNYRRGISKLAADNSLLLYHTHAHQRLTRAWFRCSGIKENMQQSPRSSFGKSLATQRSSPGNLEGEKP